eukprot:12849743-Alexandrium_andersonii.AAC.1
MLVQKSHSALHDAQRRLWRTLSDGPGVVSRKNDEPPVLLERLLNLAGDSLWQSTADPEFFK